MRSRFGQLGEKSTVSAWRLCPFLRIEVSACSQDFILMGNTLSVVQRLVCSSGTLPATTFSATPEVANVSLLGFGDVFAMLFDNHYLYIMDLGTESLISRWPLPEYRKSKRGSSFLAGEASWLNGLDGHNDIGLFFATSMPDHSIHLVLWKEHGCHRQLPPLTWLWVPGLRVWVQRVSQPTAWTKVLI